MASAGPVKSTDVTNGTVTITVSSLRGTKDTLIRVSKETVIRRWPPDSANYDDAKPGTLEQIQPGDQLRARGTKNEDGSELTAEEIISGKFRNVAGTVVTTDAANKSVTVQDLLSKSQVTLKLSASSQLRNVPQMMAQRIAMRLKGGAGQGAGTGAAAPSNAGENSGGPGNGAGGQRGDFQQMLERMPAVTLADLQKGTVVWRLRRKAPPQFSPPLSRC